MTALLLSLVLSLQPGYCRGWDKGWTRGFCYDERFCVPQIAPACPVPEAGRSTYEDGYEDGFVRGREEGQKFRGKWGSRRP